MSKSIELKSYLPHTLIGAALGTLICVGNEPSEAAKTDIEAVKTCIRANMERHPETFPIPAMHFDAQSGLVKASLVDGNLILGNEVHGREETISDANADGSLDGWNPLTQRGYETVLSELRTLCDQSTKPAPISARHCGEDKTREIAQFGPSIVKLVGVDQGGTCSGFFAKLDGIQDPVIVTASHCSFYPDDDISEKLFIVTWPAKINATTGEVETVYVSAAATVLGGYESSETSLTQHSSFDVGLAVLPKSAAAHAVPLEMSTEKLTATGAYQMWGHPDQLELSSGKLNNVSEDKENGALHMSVVGDCNVGPGISGGPVINGNGVVGLVSAVLIDGSFLFAPTSAVKTLGSKLTQTVVDETLGAFETEDIGVQIQEVKSAPWLLTKDGFVPMDFNTYE